MCSPRGDHVLPVGNFQQAYWLNFYFNMFADSSEARMHFCILVWVRMAKILTDTLFDPSATAITTWVTLLVTTCFRTDSTLIFINCRRDTLICIFHLFWASIYSFSFFFYTFSSFVTTCSPRGVHVLPSGYFQQLYWLYFYLNIITDSSEARMPFCILVWVRMAKILTDKLFVPSTTVRTTRVTLLVTTCFRTEFTSIFTNCRRITFIVIFFILHISIFIFFTYLFYCSSSILIVNLL